MVAGLSRGRSIRNRHNEHRLPERSIPCRTKNSRLEDLLVEGGSQLTTPTKRNESASLSLSRRVSLTSPSPLFSPSSSLSSPRPFSSLELLTHRSQPRELNLRQQLSNRLLVGDVVSFDSRVEESNADPVSVEQAGCEGDFLEDETKFDDSISLWVGGG